jgi:hypothetical protein
MTLGRKSYSNVLHRHEQRDVQITVFIINDSLCTVTTSGTDYQQSNEGTTSEYSTGKDTE